MLDTCILFLIKGRYIIRQYLLKIQIRTNIVLFLYEEEKMIRSEVIKYFNDKQNKIKPVLKGNIFVCNEERYRELKSKGFLGKIIKDKKEDKED